MEERDMIKTKTIAIYEKDHEFLEELSGRKKTFRDIIHDLILNGKMKGGDNNVIEEEKEIQSS